MKIEEAVELFSFVRIRMELPTLLRAAEISAFVFMPVCGFILMPTIFKSYLEWRKTDKSQCFSTAIILGTFSLILLISIFPLFISRVLDLYHWNNGRLFSLIGYVGLAGILGLWTLPSMLSSYRKLKAIQTPIHFTTLVFFGFLSFYGLSVFFIIAISLAISLMR